MPSSKPILITGAGLAGCLMATQLARLGYRVVVIEKREAEENLNQSRRTINLALAPSTLRLLREVPGVAPRLDRIVSPLQGRILHSLSGEIAFEPYAEDQSSSTLLNPAAGAVSVSRAELNALLRTVASQHSEVEFRWGSRVIACDAEFAELKTQDSYGKTYLERAEAIIAADGAGSAIRRLLKREIRENRTTLSHSYKPLFFAPNRNLQKPALHIWPRPGFLMMALPNHGDSFRGAIFLPRSGRNSFSKLDTPDAIRRFFTSNFPDVSCDSDSLVEQFAKNPISSLASVRCDPWHIGRAVLIGDAAHTLYPFSGQGANLALEDCTLLRQSIEQFAPDWPRAFAAFTAARKPKVDYLSEATRALSSLVLNALPEKGILAHV